MVLTITPKTTLKFVYLLIFCICVSCSQTIQISDKKMRFLALGDSYTIGESVTTQNRWPVQLKKLLQKKEINIESPEIIAQTGWTTDELIAAIAKQNPQRPYKLVTLLIGVNNQYRGYSLDVYKKEFKQLLDLAIKFADNKSDRVIVLSIPDWGVTPFAQNDKRSSAQIAKEIDQYNHINRTITKESGCYYVDVTPVSRKAKDIPSLTADDGLHPSAEMYKKWVDLTFDIALKIVKN